MRTNEFKKKIKELGFELGLKLVNSWDGKDTYVRQNKHVVRYFVKLGCTDDYIHLSNNLKHLDKELRDELVATCMDYAFTPIEERKEEKKYYWKVRKNANYRHTHVAYLSFYKSDKNWAIDMGRSLRPEVAQFTEREYKKMVKDNLILDIFEKEEI